MKNMLASRTTVMRYKKIKNAYSKFMNTCIKEKSVWTSYNLLNNDELNEVTDK